MSKVEQVSQQMHNLQQLKKDILVGGVTKIELDYFNKKAQTMKANCEISEEEFQEAIGWFKEKTVDNKSKVYNDVQKQVAKIDSAQTVEPATKQNKDSQIEKLKSDLTKMYGTQKYPSRELGSLTFAVGSTFGSLGGFALGAIYEDAIAKKLGKFLNKNIRFGAAGAGVGAVLGFGAAILGGYLVYKCLDKQNEKKDPELCKTIKNTEAELERLEKS